MNRYEMFAAMINGQTVTLTRPTGRTITGKILAMEIEDGSGYCFNVRLSIDGRQENVFVRSPK